MKTLKIILDGIVAACRAGAHKGCAEFVQLAAGGALATAVLGALEVHDGKLVTHIIVALVTALAPVATAFCTGFAESVEAATAPHSDPNPDDETPDSKTALTASS